MMAAQVAKFNPCTGRVTVLIGILDTSPVSHVSWPVITACRPARRYTAPCTWRAAGMQRKDGVDPDMRSVYLHPRSPTSLWQPARLLQSAASAHTAGRTSLARRSTYVVKSPLGDRFKNVKP